jgi:hypothetical protein
VEELDCGDGRQLINRTTGCAECCSEVQPCGAGKVNSIDATGCLTDTCIADPSVAVVIQVFDQCNTEADCCDVRVGDFRVLEVYALASLAFRSSHPQCTFCQIGCTQKKICALCTSIFFALVKLWSGVPRATD